jgi:hypothetical protein
MAIKIPWHISARTWKGTGVPPFLEKLIVEIDPFFDLSKVGPPSHLSKEFPFVELE